MRNSGDLQLAVHGAVRPVVPSETQIVARAVCCHSQSGGYISTCSSEYQTCVMVTPHIISYSQHRVLAGILSSGFRRLRQSRVLSALQPQVCATHLFCDLSAYFCPRSSFAVLDAVWCLPCRSSCAVDLRLHSRTFIDLRTRGTCCRREVACLVQAPSMRASECVSCCTRRRPCVGHSIARPHQSWSAGGCFGAFALQWVCTRAPVRSTSRCHLHLGFAKD